MNEVNTLEELLEIIRKRPAPTFDFQRANRKTEKKKNFSFFQAKTGLTRDESIDIIKSLTANDVYHPYSEAKMTEKTPLSLEECAHRWVFLRKHHYITDDGPKTVNIYIKIMIPTKCPPIVLVESFHESL